jgi:hypothetical protein
VGNESPRAIARAELAHFTQDLFEVVYRVQLTESRANRNSQPRHGRMTDGAKARRRVTDVPGNSAVKRRTQI